MIDVHVHLEKGPYTKEWLDEFVNKAIERKIKEVYFLEHTYIFKEFYFLYDEMKNYNAYQNNWYRNKAKKARSIKSYLKFIEEMKKYKFPIKMKFGLEVCYSPEHEEQIKEWKEKLPLDFMVGAVHFIDGWCFCNKMQKWKCEDYDMSKIYTRYFELLTDLAKSKLFDGLAHPNALQCFGAFPPGGFYPMYVELAKQINASNMYIEESSGLAINYGNMPLGMNYDMLEAMRKEGVVIHTASDAHNPSDLGKYIREMEKYILLR